MKLELKPFKKLILPETKVSTLVTVNLRLLFMVFYYLCNERDKQVARLMVNECTREVTVANWLRKIVFPLFVKTFLCVALTALLLLVFNLGLLISLRLDTKISYEKKYSKVFQQG